MLNSINYQRTFKDSIVKMNERIGMTVIVGFSMRSVLEDVMEGVSEATTVESSVDLLPTIALSKLLVTFDNKETKGNLPS